MRKYIFFFVGVFGFFDVACAMVKREDLYQQLVEVRECVAANIAHLLTQKDKPMEADAAQLAENLQAFSLATKKIGDQISTTQEPAGVENLQRLQALLEQTKKDLEDGMKQLLAVRMDKLDNLEKESAELALYAADFNEKTSALKHKMRKIPTIVLTIAVIGGIFLVWKLRGKIKALVLKDEVTVQEETF